MRLNTHAHPFNSPVSFFNSPSSFAYAASAANHILGQDGLGIAEFCFTQAILRGDGSPETMFGLADVQYRTGQEDDAIFTLINYVNSHGEWNLKVRDLLFTLSTPWRLKYTAEESSGGTLNKFGRYVIARRRLKNMKQAALDQQKKDEENLKKLVEFWKFKEQGWVKRTYEKLKENRNTEQARKYSAARKLQSTCLVINARNELKRRKLQSKHLEGVVKENLLKLLGNSKLRTFTTWKSRVTAKKKYRSANLIQDFARIILAKRKMRQERLIAKALGRGTEMFAKQCIKAWRRWVLDNKKDKTAVAMQRLFRGKLGRFVAANAKHKKVAHERIILMVLGKSAANTAKATFETWHCNVTYIVHTRNAKLKMRQERLIAKALGRGTEMFAKQCIKAWRRWVLDNKKDKTAVAMQRLFRGKLGRFVAANAKHKKVAHERIILMVLGKSAANTAKATFETWHCNVTYIVHTRNAKLIQKITRVMLGKNLLVRMKRQEEKIKEMGMLVMGKNSERIQLIFIKALWGLLEDKAAVKLQTILRGKNGRKELERKKARERKIKSLARRCLGGAGTFAMDGWKAFIQLKRGEKSAAATRIQSIIQVCLAKRKVVMERKEQARKEVSERSEASEP